MESLVVHRMYDISSKMIDTDVILLHNIHTREVMQVF